MSALVQISLHGGLSRDIGRTWGGGEYWEKEHGVHAALLAKRPVELEEFIEALTRMFGRLGMHDICEKCFAGEQLPKKRVRAWKFDWDKHYRWVQGWHWTWAVHLKRQRGLGCCGSCAFLGHNRCIKKPTGCAMFMCGYTSTLFFVTNSFMNALRNWLGTHEMYAGGCYPSAVASEGKHEYSPNELQALRIARHAVDAWGEPKLRRRR